MPGCGRPAAAQSGLHWVHPFPALDQRPYSLTHSPTTPPAPPVPQSLLELVASEVSRDSLKEHEPLQAFYANSLRHIAAQKLKGDELAAKYDGLQI